MVPSKEHATLRRVLCCLEGEFYSDAKQTASGLMLNTSVRHHGETKIEYPTALKQLALYAYKNASQYHIERRCREQFLFMEVRLHLGQLCSHEAKVYELVSRTEAFRATLEETALMSDCEGNAVTVAYVQGNKPGKSFTQWQRSMNENSAIKSKGDSQLSTIQKQRPKGPGSNNREKIPTRVAPDLCFGRCCYRCG